MTKKELNLAVKHLGMLEAISSAKIIQASYQKALLFQKEIDRYEQKPYYKPGDPRQLLIDHRNECINATLKELKRWKEAGVDMADVPKLRYGQELCKKQTDLIEAFLKGEGKAILDGLYRQVN